jgi:hypothetical protein
LCTIVYGVTCSNDFVSLAYLALTESLRFGSLLRSIHEPFRERDALFGFVGSIVPQGGEIEASISDCVIADTNEGIASPEANTCSDIDELATGN